MKKSLTYTLAGVAVIVALGVTAAFASGIIPSPGGEKNVKLPEIIVSPKQVVAGPRVALVADKVIGVNDTQSLVYQWTQIAGEKVTILSDNSSRLIFSIAPSDSDRTLTFRVDASDGNSPKTTMAKVTVLANQHPTASAGKDTTISQNQLVFLNGSKSIDPENATLTYKWLQTEGNKVDIVNSDTPSASFIAPTPLPGQGPTTLSFQLVVNDGVQDSKPDTVKFKLQITKPQIISVGPDQTVGRGQLVRLGANISASSGASGLQYTWNQTNGPIVELSDRNSPNPSFTSPSFKSDKVLTFRLTITDGTYVSKPAYTRITVTGDKPPTAYAVPATIGGSGAQITLNATGSSDPDSDLLTYSWNQTSGPAVMLSDRTSATPTFTAPLLADATSKVLSFKLIVSDGMFSSKPVYVKVTIINTTPTANAGPDQVVTGLSTVMLNASKSSTPEGTTLAYQWEQTSGPTVTLSDASSITPTFTAPSQGDKDKVMIFQVVVSNNYGKSKPDIVNITVATNRAPLANAGPDHSYADRDVVVLDGSKSIDPDGDKVTYRWKQVSGPSVSIKYGTQQQAVFDAPNVNKNQILKFELAVSDGKLTVKDTVVITIYPA